MKGINPPKLEKDIGILCYKSLTPGFGGRIKQIPEDFIVEEITGTGDVLELDKEDSGKANNKTGGYTHFTLQKRNWETLRALKEISRRLRISRNRISFAGTKDKKAVTTQRACVSNINQDDLSGINIADIILRDFIQSNDRIELGDLSGNRFTLTLRDITSDPQMIRERIELIRNDLRSGFPNFFGVQRFGTTRPITHLVGREMIRGDFETAVMIYLTKIYFGESEQAIHAREFLNQNRDFNKALKVYPNNLGYEKALLNYLCKNPGDYAGALRSLPRNLGLMFIHAIQSYIYNKALSRYITQELITEKLPLVGYTTDYDEVTSEILSEEGISREDFRIKALKEYSSRGTYRECFISYDGFSIIKIDKDELNQGKNKVVLRFSLGSGCYATTVLREFMKNQYWS